MEWIRTRRGKRRDTLISAIIFLATFGLYLRTLAPSVAFIFDDTLEFQYVVPRLGIPHQTGYPLYAILGKLFTLIVPLNDPAFRLNLLSALFGALAVAMTYFVLRHLASSIMAAFAGAITFAVGQTFWSQAVIAETYTLQMLISVILLFLALSWKEEIERGGIHEAQRRFLALAFVMGLGLAHHRLVVLLYPALALYVLLVDRATLRDLRQLSRAALLLIAPLFLYLYLPLRGTVGSADGTYVNTLQGFLLWTSAQQYSVFLAQNPLGIERDFTYYTSLFNDQFGAAGLVLAAIGLVWLLRQSRELALLLAALIPEAAFAFRYHTANVYVHFLTTFLLITLFLALGADALLIFVASWTSRAAIRRMVPVLVSLSLFAIPFSLMLTNFPTVDLSNKWDVHDYGIDVLSQPLKPDATIIGILGEMTLLRYFQGNALMRPDVQTVAADSEADRLLAIETTLKQNRAVYVTRPLKSMAEKYSLASQGPLIRVSPRPVVDAPSDLIRVDSDFGSARLLGYTLDASRLNAIPNRWHVANGRSIRVTLYWQPLGKIAADAMISLKILRKDQHALGQIDRRPVMDAYPTEAWRKGEIIADSYDVPVFLGATPGNAMLQVTLYDAESGSVIGQRDLQEIALTSDLTAPRRGVWNIDNTLDVDFGAVELVGYSLPKDTPLQPGELMPLTLLWRSQAATLTDDLSLMFRIEDQSGSLAGESEASLNGGMAVQERAYFREWPSVRVPENIPTGSYAVKMALTRNNQMQGSSWLPFRPVIVSLGQIEVTGPSK